MKIASTHEMHFLFKPFQLAIGSSRLKCSNWKYYYKGVNILACTVKHFETVIESSTVDAWYLFDIFYM